MRIVQITTDSREHFRDYQRPEPYFGTAPQGLLEGFKDLPDTQIHVISCAHMSTRAPEKIADNIWFHQPVVGKWGWGRTLFSGCIKSARNLIREINPDIVHGQGTERDCAMSAVLSGFPNVLTIHGNMRVHAERAENRSAYYRLAAILETFCLKKTNGVVAISRYTEELVQEFGPTWLLPNAVDPRFFEVDAVAPEIPRFLVVGSICERKNPIGLIKACESLLRASACRIAFAGEGSPIAYVSEFRQLADQLPGIELLGFLDRPALAEEFARSTGLILPTYEDNCPMVVLEAMAAELPVAASRVGGVPDLIEHELTGLLFDPHSSMEIAASVTRLVNDAALRKRLGEAARRHARAHFHPRVIAGRHLEIYREVLASQPPN